MRKINTIIILILIFTLPIFPLAALPEAESEGTKPTSVSVSSRPSAEAESQVEKSEDEKQDKAQIVRVYDPDRDKTDKLDIKEYIYGVVCAECPMLYHEEAIKAQIVAAYTYTLHCMEANAKAEYDLTTKPETSQAYITKEKAFENWGENAEKYDKKLQKLIDAVWGQHISYEGKPILAAYHAISAGKTESAEQSWGKAIPYLKSVDSEGDKLADKYETTAEFKLSDAEKTLKELGVTAKELKSAKRKTTDCGSVLELQCGETILTGEQIRAAFSLRSSNFKIKVTSKKLIFTVIGYGHGLGMSQNGANFMAKAGCNYEEILTHYYKGVEITKP